MLAVKVRKMYAEEVRRGLISHNLLSKEYRIKNDGEYVYFPIVGKDHEFLKGMEVVDIDLPLRRRGPTTLRELFEGKTLRAYDVIGDIAIIEIPDDLRDMEREIGEGLLKLHKNIKTVLAKDSAVHGDYRVRNVRWLAGENKSETVHREHGANFLLDVSKVYFSPRLSYERKRIAEQVRDGENILVLFGGVAPFAIVIALKKRVHVYSIEINPEAHRYALRNIEMNKTLGKVEAVCADAREILSTGRFDGWADRIVMPLPKDAVDFLPYVGRAAKKGCIVHVYAFCERDKVGVLKERIISLIGRPARVLFYRKVRTYSPEVDQYVFDVEITG